MWYICKVFYCDLHICCVIQQFYYLHSEDECKKMLIKIKFVGEMFICLPSFISSSIVLPGFNFCREQCFTIFAILVSFSNFSAILRKLFGHYQVVYLQLISAIPYNLVDIVQPFYLSFVINLSIASSEVRCL